MRFNLKDVQLNWYPKCKQLCCIETAQQFKHTNRVLDVRVNMPHLVAAVSLNSDTQSAWHICGSGIHQHIVSFFGVVAKHQRLVKQTVSDDFRPAADEPTPPALCKTNLSPCSSYWSFNAAWPVTVVTERCSFAFHSPKLVHCGKKKKDAG